MRVTVFGGTGKIGLFVVRRLLDAGHEVTTLVRSPDKVTIARNPALQVVEAELSDGDALAGVVDGADAVISALGPPIDPFYRSGPLTTATADILAAMRTAGVRRFVGLATVSVPDPRDRPSLVDRLVPVGIGLLIPGALREVQGITEVVTTTSDLDWTLARIAAPVDVPSTGTLRAGFLGRDDLGLPIARTDVAAFLVGEITDARFVGAAPAISN